MSTAKVWDDFHQMPPGREFEAYHNISDTVQDIVYHSHPYYEFYFFISGHNRVVVEGLDMQLSKGDVLIFPPGIMHRNVHQDAEVPYERFYLYVTQAFLSAISTSNYDIPGTLKDMTQNDHFCFHIEEEELDKLILLVDQMIERSNRTDPPNTLINRFQFGSLLIEAMNMMTSLDVVPQDEYSKGMGELVRHINLHIAEPLSLDDLARTFHVSKFYLLREFKNYTGISIHQYLIIRRILVSQEMIRQGQKPKEACFNCGFSDYSSYYRAFKTRIGMSPEQYRKSLEE